jgi:hypothetical protein
MAAHIGLRLASVVTMLGVLALGCASPGMPPGGPPDTNTPQIVRITPDSNAVNVQAKSAFIFFDEVVSERPGIGGGSGGRAAPAGGAAGSALAAIVSLSPSDGREDVLWRRTAIEISPRRGFRPNTAYRITLLPGVADLRGNSISVATEWVFSTGPSLPRGEVQGAVFDYAAGKAAPNAQVESFAPTDTVLRWTSRADSTGWFRVRDLTAGTYRVLAYVDANNDRRLSEREAYDTSTVTIDSLGTADLYAFVRDTVPPRIEQIELVDSTALRIRFDRPVAGDWKPEGAVALFDKDSVAIPLGGALMPSAVYDSIAQVEALAATRAEADSVPTDSVPADSVPADSVPADSIAADTIAKIPLPRFDRIAPVRQWTVRLAAPLAPGQYKVGVRGAPGLNGRSGETMRELRIREPERRPEPAPSATPSITPTARPTVPPLPRDPARPPR